MHIEEITIDGFKSYAQRVVVGKFDPHFNAITGLNGSGKSNILDSICFVLGINNLSQVTAGDGACLRQRARATRGRRWLPEMPKKMKTAYHQRWPSKGRGPGRPCGLPGL